MDYNFYRIYVLRLQRFFAYFKLDKRVLRVNGRPIQFSFYLG